MTTGESLLRAVFERPNDAATALVYADWLEETGGPAEQDRATFIRVSRRLDEIKYGDPELKPIIRQRDALLKKHEAEWLACLPKELRKRVRFDGGFVRGVSLPSPKLVQYGEALFEGHPITDVTITGKLSTKAAAELAKASWWPRVDNLRLQSCIKDEEPLRLLLACPGLTNVRELEADNCMLGLRGMPLVAGWPGLANVSLLKLMHNGLTAREMETLCASPHLVAPGKFILTGNKLDDAAARVLAGCAKLTSLGTLWLYANNIRPAGVRALVQSPYLVGVGHLSLMRNPIGNDGALALTEGFPKLETLMLSGSDLTNETVARVKDRFPFALV
jgi:uncharacterized protein (TIGR02996 family)